MRLCDENDYRSYCDGLTLFMRKEINGCGFLTLSSIFYIYCHYMGLSHFLVY
jgi:hypothetical protein